MAESSTRAGRALAERCAAGLAENDACARLLGIEVEAIGPGSAVMHMTVRADMINGQGSCHGGILFTLADAAFGYACNSRNEFSVAAGGQIEFVRPAALGDVLTATAKEQWLSGRTGLYDIEVTKADGSAVAFMRGRAHRTRAALLSTVDDDPST